MLGMGGSAAEERDEKREFEAAVTTLFGLDSLMGDLLPAPRGTSFVGGVTAWKSSSSLGSETWGVGCGECCRGSSSELVISFSMQGVSKNEMCVHLEATVRQIPEGDRCSQVIPRREPSVSKCPKREFGINATSC